MCSYIISSLITNILTASSPKFSFNKTVAIHLAVNLLRLPDNRRLRRFLPTDLPPDSNEIFFVVIFSLKLFACKSSSLLTHEALNLFIWRCATEHSSSCH
jgi:hypothetical protein